MPGNRRPGQPPKSRALTASPAVPCPPGFLGVPSERGQDDSIPTGPGSRTSTRFLLPPFLSLSRLGFIFI